MMTATLLTSGVVVSAAVRLVAFSRRYYSYATTLTTCTILLSCLMTLFTWRVLPPMVLFYWCVIEVCCWLGHRFEWFERDHLQ